MSKEYSSIRLFSQISLHLALKRIFLQHFSRSVLSTNLPRSRQRPVPRLLFWRGFYLTSKNLKFC